MAEFRPVRPEKEIISVRLPVSLVHEIERKAAATGISRNEFINQCILFAMDHLDAAPDAEDEK